MAVCFCGSAVTEGRSGMLTWRRARPVVAVMMTAASIAIPLEIGFADTASANSCAVSASFGHQYVVATYCGSNTGISGSWHNNNMGVTATYNYLTSEIWDYTNPSGAQFLEAGLIDAYDSTFGWTNPGCPSGCYAYQAFWGDMAGTGAYYFHWLTNTIPNGLNNGYSLMPNGTANHHWTVGYNLAAVGTSTVQVTNTGWEAASGADQYNTSPGDFATTFTMTDGISVGGSWTNPAWSAFYDTMTCSAHLPCFNMGSYANDEFSWNEV